MLRGYIRLFFVLALLAFSSAAHAQAEKPIIFGFNTDFRSRIASSGASQAALYGSQFDVKARLAPGLRFYYTGAQTNAPHLNGGTNLNRFITQDAHFEQEWKGQRLQVGMIRLPFGLYDHRETYVSGLIDYPLARGDYALTSVDWGAPGVRWTGGSPNLQIDAAAFGGQASGTWNNLNNVSGGAIRLQTYAKGIVLGVSRWDGTESVNFGAAGAQPTHLTGLDLRYTRPHLLVRGEYLFGKAAGDSMRGWYLDFYYHLPKYEKWTLTTRLEELKPGGGNPMAKQLTVGARYTLDKSWILAVNWRLNNKPAYGSWTPGTGAGGDVFFQLYRKLAF